MIESEKIELAEDIINEIQKVFYDVSNSGSNQTEELKNKIEEVKRYMDTVQLPQWQLKNIYEIIDDAVSKIGPFNEETARRVIYILEDLKSDLINILNDKNKFKVDLTLREQAEFVQKCREQAEGERSDAAKIAEHLIDDI